MYGALETSVSGMVAQRTRHAVIAANMANSSTLLNAEGEYEPYLRREVFFAPGNPSADSPDGKANGVHVKTIEADLDALRAEYRPNSPYADDRGYVMVPDISPVVEQVNAMDAARAYEANLAAAEATKGMMAQALRLLA
ncbi:MAG: flagellar basal body rod protein FlgC [Planctomycetota bacterium]